MAGNGRIKLMPAIDLAWIKSVKATDIDMAVHCGRDDRLLFVEWKQVDAPWPEAQMWLLRALSLRERVEVWLVEHMDGVPRVVTHIRGGSNTQRREVTESEFLAMLELWWERNQGGLDVANG